MTKNRNLYVAPKHEDLGSPIPMIVGIGLSCGAAIVAIVALLPWRDWQFAVNLALSGWN